MNNNRTVSHSYQSPPAISVLPPPKPGRLNDLREPSGVATSEAGRRIERCINYMREHLSQPLQVATLAETAHASPSHFFVLFKRCVGLSPIDYFIRLRMNHACRLLATTSMSVKEVAAVLGYEDPFYFSRVFKSVNGTPPTEYRARMQALQQTPACRLDQPEQIPVPRLAALPPVNAVRNGRHPQPNVPTPSAVKVLSL